MVAPDFEIEDSITAHQVLIMSHALHDTLTADTAPAQTRPIASVAATIMHLSIVVVLVFAMVITTTLILVARL